MMLPGKRSWEVIGGRNRRGGAPNDQYQSFGKRQKKRGQAGGSGVKSFPRGKEARRGDKKNLLDELRRKSGPLRKEMTEVGPMKRMAVDGKKIRWNLRKRTTSPGTRGALEGETRKRPGP